MLEIIRSLLPTAITFKCRPSIFARMVKSCLVSYDEDLMSAYGQGKTLIIALLPSDLIRQEAGSRQDQPLSKTSYGYSEYRSHSLESSLDRSPTLHTQLRLDGGRFSLRLRKPSVLGALSRTTQTCRIRKRRQAISADFSIDFPL